MLISVGGGGRLGNNLLQAADLAALAVEHQLEVHLLGLGAIEPFLQRRTLAGVTVHGAEARLPPWMHWLRRPLLAKALRRLAAAHSIVTPWGSVVGDAPGGARVSREEFVRAARGTRVVYTGWLFRAQDLLVRHQQAVRSLFALRPEILEPLCVRIDALRDAHGPVFGLHVRRGDYRQWLGGRFHFDDATYQRLAVQVIRACGVERGAAAIAVVSDEPTDWPARLEGFPTVRLTGNAIEDLAALSLCDRIVGPPSTFAMSASLLGAVPYLQVTDPQSPVRSERFFTYGSVPFPSHAEIDDLPPLPIPAADVRRA